MFCSAGPLWDISFLGVGFVRVFMSMASTYDYFFAAKRFFYTENFMMKMESAKWGLISSTALKDFLTSNRHRYHRYEHVEQSQGKFDPKGISIDI